MQYKLSKNIIYYHGDLYILELPFNCIGNLPLGDSILCYSNFV